MKPPLFDYVAATSVDHALELLGSEPDAKVIAGGQSLMPLLNMRLGRPDLVVDIGRIPSLDGVSVDDDGSLLIGANATQSHVLANPTVQEGWPMLAAAISQIGHPQIRNRGTVCGSLAHNDPAAELPAVALALGARLHVRSHRGDRIVEADSAFVGPFMTAIEPDDLLVAVSFPAPATGSGWAFDEFAARPGDFATVGVAATLTRDGTTVGDARIALFGVAGTATRALTAEAALRGTTPNAAADAVGAALRAELDPSDDLHASSEMRLDLAEHLTAACITTAWERCS